MKNKLIIQMLLLATIVTVVDSCTGKDERYAEMFETEYAELLQSERLQKFDQRFNQLRKIAKAVEGADSTLVKGKIADKTELCFVSPQGTPGLRMDRDPDMILFKDYTNFSKDINAVLITPRFYNFSDGWGLDQQITTIAGALRDKKTFIDYSRLHGDPKSTMYINLCEARIRMDEINNARYVTVINITDWESSVVDPRKQGENGTFKSGFIKGIVWVYDLEQDVFVKYIPMYETNSKEVKVREDPLGDDMSVDNDRDRNFRINLAHTLNDHFTIKGDLPFAY